MLWAYQYTPHIWPSIFTAMLLAVLAVYAWRRRNLPGALWFFIYCLLVLHFLVFKVIGYLAVDFETKIFWFKIEYPWWLPATTAMTCFVLEYLRSKRWLTRRVITLLFTVPLLGLFFTFSNNFQHLMFRGYGFNGSIVPLYGPVGWSFVVYNWGLRVVSAIALVWLFVRSPQHRWPAALILLAEAVVGMLLVLEPLVQESWFFYVPEKAIPVVACAIALLGYHFFDPISMARQTVIQQLQAGILVLDLEGRVIRLNPAADRILNATTTNQGKGKLVKELLPELPEEPLADMGETEIEFGIGEGPDQRYYLLRVWPLNDFRGLAVGFLLLLTDVTEQKRVQTQVLDQQRALTMSNEREKLARELHDNLGQVFAFINTQGQTIRRLLSRGDLLTADEYLCRLLDVVSEADVDVRESITGLRATISEYGLLPTLREYLAKFEKNYGIQVYVEGFDSYTTQVFEPLVEVQLLSILQEALANVRKHANACSVRIAFALENGWVRVTIRDDGRGFNPEKSSTGIGGHIGLRVMRERAEEVGGSLSLKSALGEGTELVMRVPVKKRIEDPEKERIGE